MLDRSRRIRGKKSLRRLRAFQRRPEIPEILLERGLADVLERRNADRELPALRGAGERAPAAREKIISRSSGDRGKAPACVVRIRSRAIPSPRRSEPPS